MKKILILFLLFLPIVSSIELEQNNPTMYQGREIILTGVEESKILISVDGTKNIVNLNQQKEINGVKVTLNEIFFADEFSTANITLELSYNCGDNNCDDSFENYENCCQDCGCDPSTTDKCIENECTIPECNRDIDCNDNDPLTEDTCDDYKCKFKKIKCSSDTECDDNDPDTDDTCDKGNCKNILNYVCKVDIDCEDYNPCTIDKCVEKDCVYENLEDCKPPEENNIEPKEEDTQKEEGTSTVNSDDKGFFSKLFSWIFNLF